MAGLLPTEGVTRVFNAWRRALRADPLISRLPLPDLRPLAEAFNAALTGDDDESLPAECERLAATELDASAVIKVITLLAETVADEVGTTSGATTKSLLSTLGGVAGLLSTDMVRAEAVTARRDYLTGLENRLAWDEALDAALDSGGGLTLVMLDLDGLKQVNDTRGHEAGDEYLKRFAADLRAAIPEGVRAYRFGGDEYAAVFPTSDRAAADRVMTELGRNEDVAPFSYGIAVAPEDGTTSSALKQKADNDLYEMKRAHKAAGETVAPDETVARAAPAPAPLQSQQDPGASSAGSGARGS
jgi:diguanylate cyclase (GGDEF)-like protein